MKATCIRIRTTLIFILSVLVAMTSTGFAANETGKIISPDQLGAEAGKDYHGVGLSVTPTTNGADLRCDFQKLRGHATAEGLWLESTPPEVQDFPVRIIAHGFGRESLRLLPATGQIECYPFLARFVRPGVIEEYSVNVDGVRQDFLVNEKPSGSGPLRVELSVDGAKAATASSGVTLVLKGSERKLAYDRLNVTDANGRTLTARIEVGSERRLEVVVDDATAAYPVRIDPTTAMPTGSVFQR